jgi:hypothetical protein
LARFARCSVERISVPQWLEIIEDGAFEDCHFLGVVDFSSCTNLRVLNGFSGYTAIYQITIPIWVEMMGRQAFNDVVSLRHLVFDEGSHMCEVRGFARSGLMSVTFPPSMRILASGACNDSRELSLIIFENGSLISEIRGMRPTDLRLLLFRAVLSSIPGSFTGVMAHSGLSWIISFNGLRRCDAKPTCRETVKLYLWNRTAMRSYAQQRGSR